MRGLIWVGLMVAKLIALPGTPPVGIDYSAYDPVESRLWIPAGNTGDVVVIRTTHDGPGASEVLGGFATAAPPSTRPNRPRLGPSSVTVAGDVVWIGNRADLRLCAVSARTLRRGPCKTIESMPDGLAYVEKTGELWVTTPRALGITIVDVGDTRAAQIDAPAAGAGSTRPSGAARAEVKKSEPAFIKLDGQPEGYAVDPQRGLFYTNLENRDRTLAIDVTTRRTVGSWPAGCGTEGPRGLALDARREKLLVACTHGVIVLDVGGGPAASGGARLAAAGRITGRLETGGGVDNLDFDPKTGLVYVASGADGTLTFARLDDRGSLTVVGKAATAPGARNAVIDAWGRAYVPDSAGGRLIVLPPPTL